MRFDACAQIGLSYKGTSFLVEDYVKEMERNGISKAMLVPEKPLSYDITEGNDYVEKMISNESDKFIGAVRVDPWNHDQINRELVKPILEFDQQENKPVIIEAGYVWVAHVAQIAEIAAEYPEVKFLMLNAAQMDLSGYTLTDVKHFMGKRPNLYLGTNGAVAADWLVDIYRNISPGKVIFCSNYPFFEVDLECRRIELCYFTDKEREEIFSQNAEKFFE